MPEISNPCSIYTLFEWAKDQSYDGDLSYMNAIHEETKKFCNLAPKTMGSIFQLLQQTINSANYMDVGCAVIGLICHKRFSLMIDLKTGQFGVIKDKEFHMPEHESVELLINSLKQIIIDKFTADYQQSDTASDE